MTLDEMLDRLRHHDAVDGIMLLGTTGTGAFTSTSDYDLLLVLRELTAPIRIVNTWLDGRLTEIACTTTFAIERIVAEEATWADGSEEATVLTWLREGRIAFDRIGALAAACADARSALPPTLADARQIHEAWRKIGYNVAQIKRYLAADDPISQTIVDMRLLYSVAEVNLHYFTVRRIPWRGEKPAIRFWLEHDPEYLQRLRRLWASSIRVERVSLYEELAALALAPCGGLWQRGETAISLGAGYGTVEDFRSHSGTLGDAETLWNDLMGITG